MKDPFYIRPYRSRGRPRLKYVGIERSTGKKRFFESHRESKRWAHVRNTQAGRHGTEAAISAELAAVARRGERELEQYGEGLVEAIACRLAFHQQRARSCAIDQLFAELAESKRSAGCSAIRVSFIKLGGRRLAEFAEKRGLKLVSDFSDTDIREFLDGLLSSSPCTWNNNRELISTAFNYAKKRGYISENVVKKIDPRKIVRKPIEYFEPNEAAKLLAACTSNILPGAALQLFAGLRKEEVVKLNWSDVHLWNKPKQDKLGNYYGVVNIPAAVAKDRDRRPIKIRTNLAAWLLPFAKPNSRVVTDYNRGLTKACKRAGILRKRNALRHSYATYHCAYFNDPNRLMWDMGHESLSITAKHYLNFGVSDEDAAAYWQIAPFSRPETLNIFAFKPESYWWFRRVENIAEGNWIVGITNFERHFCLGSHGRAYHWFKMPGLSRPPDDRYHIPTWRSLLEQRGLKHNIASKLYYVVWRSSPQIHTRELRKGFASLAEAEKFGDEDNQELLAKEVHLADIANVIDFSAAPQAKASDQLISA